MMVFDSRKASMETEFEAENRTMSGSLHKSRAALAVLKTPETTLSSCSRKALYSP